MEEYSVTKYTISKLIDKLTWAEHTAGTLQAENDRLRKELSEKEAEIERLERAVAENLSTITYWKDAAEKSETLTKENEDLRTELSDFKVELDNAKFLKNLWWEKYREAKNLVQPESDDDPDKILVELPESLEEEMNKEFDEAALSFVNSMPEGEECDVS